MGGINYTVRMSTRAKHLRIDVYPDTRVVVVVPKRANPKTVEQFIRAQSEWVQRKVQTFQKHADKGGLVLPAPKRGDYKKYKEQARSLALARLEHFNQHYGFTYNRVAIRDQKTRWGSCSSKGHLNFNYKIVHLPQAHADYIIVHELCHLKEMNHSERFWDLVAETVPDHKQLRKELTYSRFSYT